MICSDACFCTLAVKYNLFSTHTHFLEVLCICIYIYLYSSSFQVFTLVASCYVNPIPCFSAMATVWLRHPRYSLLILFTLLTTFYLLFVPHHAPIHTFHVQDDSLQTRVQRSHTIYDKFLVQRAGLLKKWGPEPKDISVYVYLLLRFCIYDLRLLITCE